MSLYNSLLRWNLWGSWQIPKSFKREVIKEVSRYLQTEEVIAFIGPRRAGKSTLLYQVMEVLRTQGVSDQAILHVNFEELGLSPYLAPQLLDKLYDLFRSKVFPKGKAYIFLDEIQNVPEWERWVRARNDTEDIKIFITGSSSELLSGELATVLSGRNFCFDIYPLSFREMLEFKGIIIPELTERSKPPIEVEYALNQYLQWGGFPRVVLAQDDIERERILRRYFDEIIFKDVVQRHQIRNIMALRNIAVHLLANTSTLISYKRLADIFQVSQDLAQAYVSYLSEAFIIKPLGFYSLKAAERMRNPLKVHAIDLGLRKVASLSASEDYSKLIETQVHNQMLRMDVGELYYWKGDGEIDLLTQNGVAVTGLYQVAYEGIERENVAVREMGGLKKAQQRFTQAALHLITWQAAEADEGSIENIPLWKFLLEDKKQRV